MYITENEKLMAEWDWEKNNELGLNPEKLTHGSNKKAWWKCSVCGYKWEAKIGNRSILKRGCPNCAGQVLIKGKNDLETLNPQLACEWNYEKNGEIKPSDIRLNHNSKVWWTCPQGHEYQASPNHRNNGTNCPICNSGRQTSFAEQAVYYYIKKIYPDAVNRYREIFDNKMEVDIYIPSLKTAIEYDGVYWHNRKEKSKQREIIKYQKCKQQGIRLIRLRESISNTEHEIADICFYVENVDNIKNLNMLIRHLLDEIDLRSNMWTRKNPRMVHSPVNVDADRDRFEILKYKQVSNKNNLKELYPELAKEWNYEKNGNFTPDKVTPGSDKRVWWKCKECGHEWITTVGHRVGGTGCPICATKQNRDNHYLAKKIYQYSLNNTFIREWNSISAASRELKINDSNIGMCAKGKRKSAGGFIWRYKKD